MSKVVVNITQNPAQICLQILKCFSEHHLFENIYKCNDQIFTTLAHQDLHPALKMRMVTCNLNQAFHTSFEKEQSQMVKSEWISWDQMSIIGITFYDHCTPGRG